MAWVSYLGSWPWELTTLCDYPIGIGGAHNCGNQSRGMVFPSGQQPWESVTWNGFPIRPATVGISHVMGCA